MNWKKVSAVIITEQMGKEEAFQWAKHTNTFTPFVKIIRESDGRYKYQIVRVLDEAEIFGDILHTNMGTVFSCDLAFQSNPGRLMDHDKSMCITSA